jgi:heptaprenylglyceryl phosphate synthase
MPSTDFQNTTTIMVGDEKNVTIHRHPTEDECATSEVSMIQVFSKKGMVLSWMALLVIALMNSFDSVAVNTFQIYAVSEYKRLLIEGALTTALGVATIGRRSETLHPQSL